MTEKEKAAVEYLPAPTGQNQPLGTEPTNIVTQATANFNEEISKITIKLMNMGDIEVGHINRLPYCGESAGEAYG